MNNAKRRAANRRVFQVEGLEGRELLASSVTAGAISAMRVSPLIQAPTISRLQGRISGTQASDGLYGGTPAGYLSYSGHGTSRVGQQLFGTTYLASPGAASTDPWTIQNGTAVFRTNSNGDQLHVQFTGVSTSRTSPRSVYSLQGSITGGTGRFAGATGPFAGTLTTFHNATISGQFSLSYNIAFNNPV